MKVSLIGHAAILVETRGCAILSDPWWQGPCFGAQWWVHPQPDLTPLEARTPDYIYISHGHADHLHPGTLRRLPKSATVLVSDALDIAEPIRAMGFPVIELPERTPVEIAPDVRVEITPTHGDDTLMVIDDGTERLANLNDALHAAPQHVQDAFIAELTTRYGRFDYVFCGYGVASHFPVCYVVPGNDREAMAAARQSWFNHRWSEIVAGLAPRIGVPFAADVAFLEDDLAWSNEVIHNTERPTDVFRARFPDVETQVIDAAPGLVLEDGRVTREVLFRPVDTAALFQERPRDVAAANKFSAPSRAQVEDLAESFRATVERCGAYLREFDGDYAFLIRLRQCDHGITLRKQGRTLTVETVAADAAADCDIVYTTRYAYLRRSLSERYGHEVLFVGSGGIFTYRRREDALRDLHRELQVVLRQRDEPPRSRYGDQPKALYTLKRMVKGMVGARDPGADLYALRRWLVPARESERRDAAPPAAE